MAYEMRPGQGSAFVNDKKTTDKHPDFKGKVMLPNGETRWLSMWNKTSQAGKSFISISVGDVVQDQGAPVYSAAHQPFASSHDQAKANGYQPQGRDLDSDIPF